MKLTKALLIEMIKEEIEAVLDEQAVNESRKLDRYKANIANMTDDRASEVFQLLIKPESQQMTTLVDKERELVLALLKLKLGIEISDDDRRSIKNAERTFSAYQSFKKRTGYKEPKFESTIDEQKKVYDYENLGPGFVRQGLSDDYKALVNKVKALDLDKLEKEYPGIKELETRILRIELGALEYIDKYLDEKNYKGIIGLFNAEDKKAAYFRGGRSGGRSRSA